MHLSAFHVITYLIEVKSMAIKMTTVIVYQVCKNNICNQLQVSQGEAIIIIYLWRADLWQVQLLCYYRVYGEGHIAINLDDEYVQGQLDHNSQEHAASSEMWCLIFKI